MSVGAAFFLGAVATPLLAQEYSIVDLGTLGGSTSRANGINADGIIAGNAKTPGSVQHAVIWDEGTIVDLGAPDDFLVSTAVAVNDARQVAANGEGDPQSYQAYRWDSGVWTPLGVLPGRSESIAADIDSNGRIVGRSFTLGAGDGRGFLWDTGVLADLGTLGGATSAEAINNVGQIVGSSRANLPEGGQPSRAFIWEDSVMTNLGVLPGEESSWAFDVNDHGDVVGSSWHVTSPNFLAAHRATLWRDGGAEVIDLGRTPGPEACILGVLFYSINIARAVNDLGQVVGEAMCVGSGGPLAAFLWSDSVMYNLNDLIPPGTGWNLLTALDINNRGEIVGTGVASDGYLHAFLLTPVPTAVRSTTPSLYALKAFPNPFTDGTRISYRLPRRSRVRVTVYDVLGRRVATLVDGVQSEGSHTVAWPGRNDSGAAVASGIYALRLEGDEGLDTLKMLVLR